MQISHLVTSLDQVPSQWVGNIMRGMRHTEAADSADSRTRAEKILARIAAQYKGLTFLPLSESYTDETQEMRNTYRVMLRDPTVKASVMTKLMAVCQLDPQVHPASEQGIDHDAADFVRYALTKCKGGTRRMNAAILLGAILDGYSVCEKVWKIEDRGRWAGKYRLAALKSKDTLYIDLLTDEFRNVTGIRDRRTQKEYHPSNFVVYTHMPLFESPTGMSDLRAAYRAYWLLDTAWKLRAIGLERFTLPMLKGTYADDTHKAELEAALASARAQSWVSVPQGALIEAIELSAKGQSDFASAIADLKEEIALGITGAVLQMLQGQVADGRGSSVVHRSTAELLQWWLAAEAGDVITDQIVPDLVTFNFEQADFPTVTFGGVDDGSMTASITIDNGLHAFLPLSRKEMYQRYGRQEPTDDADSIQPAMQAGAGPLGIAAGGNLAFAEPEPPADPKAQAATATIIMELQKAYIAGELSRDAAIANAVVSLKLDRAQADSLFPLITDADVSNNASKVSATNVAEPMAEEPAWLLDIPHVEQATTFDCGAAAVKAVNDYFHAPAMTLADYYTPLGTTTKTGTTPAAIVEFFKKAGKTVHAKPMTLQILDATTKAGEPVICPVQHRLPGRSPSGHYVTVRGLDDANVYIEDPVGGRRTMARAAFDAMWNDRDYQGKPYVRWGIAVSAGPVAEQPDIKAADNQPATEAKVEPAPTGQAPQQVAGTHADANKVQDLLHASEREGIQAIDKLARRAVGRLLAKPDHKLPLRLFDDNERKQLADALAKVNGTANLYGQARVHLLKERVEQQHRAGVTKFADTPLFVEKFAEPQAKPLMPEAAAMYFNNLVPTLKLDTPRFGEGQRRKAFTLAAATDLQILNRVRAVIDRGLSEGAVSSGPAAIDDILDGAGISVRNPQYSQMAFRTNMMDSYTTGTMDAMQDPDVADVFPCWQYLGIRDGRQGEDHEPHFDKLYPNDVPFAVVRGDRPFNCRCVLPEAYIAGVVRNATRSRYWGPAIEIKTASGHSLKLTPNHPVLTMSGYRPAGKLVAGDMVVTQDGVAKSSRTKINTMFKSLSEDHFGVIQKGSATDKEFHGDGVHVHTEVLHYSTDRPRRIDATPIFDKRVADVDLATHLRAQVGVILDEVVSVEPFDYDGFVYDLGTVSDFYSATHANKAGGIIVHNCKPSPVSKYELARLQAAGIQVEQFTERRPKSRLIRFADLPPITWHGLPIRIEIPAGGQRTGTNRLGQPWSSTLEHAYGSIPRTEGADGESVDCYVGPELEHPVAYIIDQLTRDGAWDEHKCMLGFPSVEAAVAAYDANYPDDWRGLGAITAMDADDFLTWVRDGQTDRPLTWMSPDVQRFCEAPRTFADRCPVCDETYIARRRSQPDDRACRHGHEWHTDERGHRILGNGHKAARTFAEKPVTAPQSGGVYVFNEPQPIHVHVAAAPAPNVTINHTPPPVNLPASAPINIDVQPANVTLPPMQVTVPTPSVQIQPPHVDVHVAAPEITVEAPNITVESPTVELHPHIEVAQPQIEIVNQPPAKNDGAKAVTFQRDGKGNITGAKLQ